jgi:GT2 family glycosyltransferase/glycosyltransferase involved in cell wall biosynthesis
LEEIVKTIGLMCVKNERKLIEFSTQALARFVDGVCVLDDGSTDGTLELLETLKTSGVVNELISKPAGPRDEPGDRSLVLQAGRDIGGTHFIFLDADEVLTGNFLPVCGEVLESLQPGESFSMNLIHLWKSINQYRHDNSIWTHHYKALIFADDGKMSYRSDFIHTERCPVPIKRSHIYKGWEYGYLHFLFVYQRDMRIKQFWYKMLELHHHPERSAADLNQKYACTVDETDIRLKAVNPQWFAGYEGLLKPEMFLDTPLKENWRWQQIQDWLKIYPAEKFAGLDTFGLLPELEELTQKKYVPGFTPSSPEPILVSVIVPLFNAVNYTRRMVESFFANQPAAPFELIFVDNASTDETPQFLETLSDRATIITNQSNLNFSGACNQGARAAKGKYLLFLNSDTLLLPGWLEPMVAILERERTIGVVGNKHIYPGTRRLHHAGVCFDSNYESSHYLVNVDFDDPRVNYRRDFQAVNGACLLIRRELFAQIGGFNEMYKNGCEDLELCLEVRKLGYRVTYTPDSQILHFGQRSPGRNNLNNQNIQLFKERWQGIVQPDLEHLAAEDNSRENRNGSKNSIEIKTSGSRTRKAAFLTTYNQACGIATHTSSVLRALIQHPLAIPESLEILIFAEDTPNCIEPDPKNVFRCWKRENEDFHRVLRLLESEQIDILHIQYHDGLFGRTAIDELVSSARLLGVKVFITFHSTERLPGLSAKLVNLSTHSFVHLDQSVMRFVAYGADPGRISVVPHGIDASLAPLPILEAKRFVEVPSAVKLVTSLGFLEPHKGVKEIIQALPEVLSKHEVAFVFLGGPHPMNHHSIQYMEECRRLSQDLGIEERVILAGSFMAESYLSQYLSASDLIILNYTSDKNEASGALAQALAHHRPVITTNKPPFKALSGCTLQLSDGLSISEAICRVLENPQLGAALVERADRYVKENSFAQLAGILLNWYFDPAPPGSGSEPGLKTLPLAGVKIGVDARTLFYSSCAKRGIGHYTYYHLLHLARQRPEWQFILFGPLDSTPDLIARLSALPNVIRKEASAYRPEEIDLLHIPDPMTILPDYASPFDVFPAERKSVIFYDLIPLRFNWEMWDDELRQLYLIRLQQLRASRAVILNISEFTGWDLQKEGFDPEQMITIMAGLNQSDLAEGSAASASPELDLAFLKKLGVKGPFFLYIGAADPHKNFVNTIRAFVLAQKARPQIQLVVPGSKAHYQGFPEAIAEQKVRGVVFTDFIAREDLELLYREATALVCLSKYEGFGFPVLEAMGKGCPVICSNTTSLPEVAGEAALLFDPEDKQGVAAAMLYLLDHPHERQKLREKGLKQAQRFTWEAVADKTLAAWEKLLAGKPAPDPHAVPSECRPQTRVPELCPAERGEKTGPAVIRKVKPGFNVIGYLNGNLGIGVIARNILKTLVEGGYPVSAFCLDPGLGRGGHDRRFDRYNVSRPEELKQPTNLFVLPLLDLTALLPHFDRNLAGRLNVALTYWELPVLPPQTIPAMQKMDVLLAESKYMQHAYSFHLSGVHVLEAAHPVYLPEGVQADRPRFGVQPEGLAFVTSFEPHSDVQRKNPRAVVEAFQRAFGKGAGEETAFMPPRLVIKVNNGVISGQKHPALRQLQELASSDPRLQLITQTLSYPEVLSLYASCDAFVSLHRSEGLGLGLMEAMALGKPVIATGWSGNMSFMNHTNSCPVGYRLVPADGSIPAYQRAHLGEGAVWADPDVEEAAAWMRRLVEDASLRRQIGEQAAGDMRRYQEKALRASWIDELEAIREQKLYRQGRDGRNGVPPIQMTGEAGLQPSVIQCASAAKAQVDIVIPIYGQPERLQRCVDSVLRTAPEGRLILVDDCSPGREIEGLFQSWAGQAQITLARTPANSGFIGACKLGASLGQAPFILFLNSDTEALASGWLERLIPAQENVAIAGAKLLYPPSLPGPLAGCLQHAGVARNDQGVPYHPFMGRPASLPEANEPRFVNAVTGACFLIRRSVWDELGGWDPRFGKGVYEDVDLCWQARRAGYRVLYQPTVELYHDESASKASDGGHPLNIHTQENLQKLLEKWGPANGGKLGSDEALFFGEKTIRRWRRAVKDLQRARACLEAGNAPAARSAMRKAVETAYDLPQALSDYAQLMASQGDWAEAARYLEQAVHFAPASWEARLRLVDAWIGAGQPDKASQALAELRAVFPAHPQLQERADGIEALAQGRAAAACTAPEGAVDQAGKPPAAAEELTGRSPAVETLELLLGAEDLLAALERYSERLDEGLLELVRQNARAVQADGDQELAEGLEALAEYVQEAVRCRRNKTAPLQASQGR